MVKKPIEPPILKPAFVPGSLRPIPCVVGENEDGSCEIILHVDADIMRRMRNRAQSQDLGTYLWQNVIRAALESHVF